MSTTETTHETVSTDEPSTETTTDAAPGLAEIVAQTVPVDGDLPDFDEFRAVCGVTRDSIRLAAGEEI